MSILNKRRWLVAVVWLGVVAFACNRSTPTVTLVSPLPTLARPTASPPPTVSPSAATTHTPTSLASERATETPSHSPTPSPVIPSACPPPGNPAPPERPAAFENYPEILAAYLSAGGSVREMERLLREWGAITDELGTVRSLDMTGDRDPEVVVALVDPAPEVELPWPPGDVLILQCKAGVVVPAYRGRGVVDQDPADLQFRLEEVEDVNGTGRADVVYVTSMCGAHTCWDRLYIIEWDGMGFVNRIADMADYPYATFSVGEGQVAVEVGGIGSAGAGYQRNYREVWAWDGRRYAVTEQSVGPPTALIHYVHDGDDALARGDFGKAMEHYEAVLTETELPAGLTVESEEQGVAILKAYARFKLVVAYAASGDGWGGQGQYDALVAENPEGTPGYPYLLLGQAFWSDFVASDNPRSACAAAVTMAEGDPTLAERLYAGYANREYEPGDLCKLK